MLKELGGLHALVMSKPLYLTGESASYNKELIAETKSLEMELSILSRISSKTWSWED